MLFVAYVIPKRIHIISDASQAEWSFLNVLILDTEYRVTMKRLVLGINVETFDGKVPDRKGTWKSTQEFQKLSEEKLGFSSVSFRRNATEAEVRTDFQCLKEQLCEDYGSDRFVNLDLLDSNTDPRPETDMVMIFVSSHAPGPNYQGCIVL